MLEVEDYIEARNEAFDEAIREARRKLRDDIDDPTTEVYRLQELASLLVRRSYLPLENLDEAILLNRQALELIPKSPQRAADLSCLADLTYERYALSFCDSISGAWYLDESIKLRRSATDLFDNLQDRAIGLKILGDTLLSRYKRTGVICHLQADIRMGSSLVDYDCPTSPQASIDLDDAIKALGEAVASTIETDIPDRHTWLFDLGTLFSIRYNDKEAIEDLEEAINLTRQSHTANEVPKSDVSAQLSELLVSRYLRTDETSDIEEAIELAREPPTPTSEGRFFALRRLSDALFQFYKKTRSMKYLDEAIELAEKGVERAEHGIQQIQASSFIKDLLLERYDITKDMADLDDVIDVLRYQVKTMFSGRNNTGFRRLLKDWWYHQVGETASYEPVLDEAEKQPAYICIGGSSQIESLLDLNYPLHRRYLKLGNPEDLIEIVQNMRRVVGLVPRPSYLLTLGFGLIELYYETHDQTVADEAAEISLQLSSGLEDQGTQSKGLHYMYIALELSLRTRMTGNDSYLDQAIGLGSQAARMFPNDHSSRAAALDDLGSMFYQRFNTTRSQLDLDNALKYYEEACTATENDNARQGHYLSHHSRALLQRHRSTISPDDLGDAIHVGRRAVAASSNYLYMRQETLNHLAIALYQRFLARGTREDLEEAIDLNKQAVETNQEDAINGCSYFVSLASMLCERHVLTDGPESLDDLSEAIQLVDMAHEAGGLHDKPHPNLAGILCYFSSQEFIYFPGMTQIVAETCVWKCRDTLESSTEKSLTERAWHLSNLVLALSCFSYYGELADRDEPTRLGRKAIEMAQTINQLQDLAWHLCCLAVGLGSRFNMTKNPGDLAEAITLSQCALEMSPKDDGHRPFYLIVLASGLHCRYSHTGRLPDLYESIRLGLQGWRLSSLGNTLGDCYNQLWCAGNITRFLTGKYLREGSASDLERVIEFQRATDDRIRALGAGKHVDFYNRHLGMGNAETTPDDPAIEMGHLTLYDLSDCPRRLYNLSVEWFQNYNQGGDSAMLSNATLFGLSSVNSTPRGHAQRPSRLEHLGTCFKASYDRERNAEQRIASSNGLKDLNSAIDSFQDVVDTASQDSPVWLSALHRLGPLYSDRYHRSGDMADLRMALVVLQESVDVTTQSDGQRSARLRHLATGKKDSHAIFNKGADLEMAKTLFQEAIDTTAPNCSSRAVCLVDLAEVYQAKYHAIKSQYDLSKSLELYEEALRVWANESPSHEYSTKLFCGRGLSHIEKYKVTKIRFYLDRSIQDIGQAVQSLSTGTPGMLTQLVTLADIHITGYSTTQVIAYMDTATRLLKEAGDSATRLSPRDASDRIGLFHNIGDVYRRKYDATNLMPDLESAISFLDEAFTLSPLDTAGDLMRVISIAQSLASALMVKKEWHKAFTIIDRVVPMIATTTPRFLDISESQALLSRYSCLASDGAALAMSTGCHSLNAIQVLEAGRGVAVLAWSELRYDMTFLRSLDESKRAEFLAIREELDGTSLEASRINDGSTQLCAPSGEARQGQAALQKAARRLKAAQRLNGLILGQHRFKFQMAFSDKISSASLAQASLWGHVVVINVSYRCDAFLIKGPLPQALPLPKLSRAAIQDRINQGNLTSPQILEWLWDTVVSPVLDALGYTKPPPLGEAWPRIWWIPIGPLSKFPLHAAGRHLEKSHKSAIDRVISSYSPSIRALEDNVNRAVRSARARPQVPAQARALMVAMEHTPDSSPLPFAGEEVKAVLEAFRPMSVKLLQLDQRTKEMVLALLRDSDIFHFAGHGYTDDTDPSQSHLRLQDWEENPLTVADLLAMNLREQNPFLAYLGACGTGQIEEAKHLDEGVHLISACQLAGFRHVVGTLCKVNDETCVDIARITYEVIRDKGMSDDSVSEGLHHAIRELRDRWRDDWQRLTRGRETKARGATVSNAFLDEETRGDERCGRSEERSGDRQGRDASPYESDEDDYQDRPLQWAPYVHYGI
ncbi:CHAT domain-containing protein [Fusarium sp. LHS14.1]|nr:CHAT domain-containing protein [Fusarium sp. LHS14.1]